jgi:UDP-N-acetylglucosamine/UDP-N-acetylgalactosamine diphosphorylase
LNPIDERHDRARKTLDAVGQSHLLNFYPELDAAGRGGLLDQIESQDWPALAELVETHVKKQPELHLPSRIEPAECFPAAPSGEDKWKAAEARKFGEHLIKLGRVAAFVVAGGQGTRLGWDAPKGTFPATPISGKPLFQLFAESIMKTQRKYNAAVPWYVMTSPQNDAPTRAFFKEHRFFGLNPKDVLFFPQGTLPSFSLDGKVLLERPGQIALNPDGHGGSLRAIKISGALDDMNHRGIQQISYFQVDNPLVSCVDPLFIGLHAQAGAEMSSKMALKVGPLEKVGNFCRADGRVCVIEYSDLPNELAEQRNPDGSLKFNAGSLAIHVIDKDFVERLNQGRFGLPYHRAVKKVPHIDAATGAAVTPDKPNAVKLETFVFDALALCEKSIVLETKREEEFGPIKNAEGADSAVTSKQLQSDRAARWLAAAGVQVPKRADGTFDATIELSPLTAIEAADLTGPGAPKLPGAVAAGSKLSL